MYSGPMKRTGARTYARMERGRKGEVKPRSLADAMSCGRDQRRLDEDDDIEWLTTDLHPARVDVLPITVPTVIPTPTHPTMVAVVTARIRDLITIG